MNPWLLVSVLAFQTEANSPGPDAGPPARTLADFGPQLDRLRYWTGNSSLIIKEPSRGLTFVALTNSDQLSARFKLGSGDLMSSTVAQAFVDAFVTGSLGAPRD